MLTQTSSTLFCFFKRVINRGPINGASIILTNNLNTKPVKCGATKQNENNKSNQIKINYKK